MPANARPSVPNTKRPARRASQAAKGRSRAGCVTCKTKHVKCDETLPTCLTCTRKGVKCEYRRGELKWSYKHQPMTIESFSSQHEDDELLEMAGTGSAPAASFELSVSQSDDAFLRLMESCQAEQAVPDEPARFPSSFGLWSGLSIQDIDDGSQDVPSPGLEAEKYLARASTLTSGPETTVALMSSWFDRVCPAWSAFDSGLNLNRKLADDLWHNSAAVFNSLQSMSASFLSARLPHMRQFALSLMKTATLCIQAEVGVIRRQAHMDVIPTGVLFSLFCLGTTVCWLDASRLGRPFLNEAKYILRRLAQQYTPVSNDDKEVLMFFKKSMVYWEMLLAVADDPEEQTDDIAPGHHIWPEGDREDATVDKLPHPWTGISTRTSHLFARSIKLCRAHRYESTTGQGGARNFLRPTNYFEEAQRLEEQLLELEFSSLAPTNDTGDQKTPWLHLAHVAEAYQLSSLLQLYETFPGLVSLRLPLDSIMSEDGQVPWERWIVPLSLRLTEVLEHIPPDSGSRVIQPLLYICASTGLRYNLLDSPTMLHRARQVTAQGMCLSINHTRADPDLLEYIGQIDTEEKAGSDPPRVSQAALDICKAREFITSRLNMLERSLQPKPVIVAKELVKAIWVAYDCETPGSLPIHWLDVMENQELRSLFG